MRFVSRGLVAVALASACALVSSRGVSADTGFDEYGYNDTARTFNGPADGVDRNLDGKYAGSTTWANDRLKMTWSEAWAVGKATQVWSPDAWIDNQWNGQVPGGSGETWHYRIVWVGPLGPNSPYWREGGSLVWGQFEVILSQGTSANAHFWDVLALSAGYGGPN